MPACPSQRRSIDEDRTEHVKQILAAPRPVSLDPREAYNYLMNDFDRIKQVILSEDQLVAMNYVGAGNWKGLVQWERGGR